MSTFFAAYLGVAWVAIVLLTLRELVLATRFTVADRTFAVRPTPPAPWARGMSLALADVDRVEVLAEKDGTFRLRVVLRGGQTRKVPLSLDGPPIKGSWTTQVMFAAPVESWDWLAARLNERLEDARRETGPTYR